MNIQDAIKKVGLKIRRKAWVDVGWFFEWKDDNPINQDGQRVFDMTIHDALADDWEVVEDKQVIEVGDVVKHASGCENQCVVIKIGRNVCVLALRDACACNDPLKKFKLIRKGPKKFIKEGVKATRVDALLYGTREAVICLDEKENMTYSITVVEEVPE